MQLLRASIKTEPKPKERPRVVNGHTFTPKATLAFEKEVGFHLRRAMTVKKPSLAEVKVVLILYLSHKRRCDIDNLIKAILDSANGIVWKDDAQVVELHARLHRGSATPGFYIEVNTLEP